MWARTHFRKDHVGAPHEEFDPEHPAPAERIGQHAGLPFRLPQRGGLHRLKLDIQHFTLSPIWEDPPKYRLHIERGDIAIPELRQRLATNVDTDLQELNVEYREKRQTGRLGPLECLAIPNGTWDRFIRQKQSRFGASLEQ